MSLTELRGIWWLLLLLGPLLFLQRRMHREIQAIILLATHRADLSIAIFSILFLPGILLHEGSHFVMARLLGVRTGRFSIVPQATGEGRLQLGYVETSQTDPVRDALIGLAPLVSGSLFVAYAGLSQLGFAAYWDSLRQMEGMTLRSVFAAWQTTDDFWLWFYLVFVIAAR
jgi:hypothetical protein